jgi:hypothetical protein
MVEDPKKSTPKVITGYTWEEMCISREAWLNGATPTQQHEAVLAHRARKTAEMNLAAAKLQVEAADKMFEALQRQQSEASEPEYIRKVRAQYPGGVPKGKIKTAWRGCAPTSLDYNRFYRALRNHGLIAK